MMRPNPNNASAGERNKPIRFESLMSTRRKIQSARAVHMVIASTV